MAKNMVNSDPRIDVLKNISSIVSAVLDMDQLMYILIKVAIRVTGAKASSLLLVDEENQTLHFFIASGEGTQELKHQELNMGEGIAGWVAREGTPVLVENVKEDKRWNRDMARMIDFDIHSIACAPMKVDNKVIGVIEIIDKHNGETIKREDMNLLLAFADMAASFLEKSKRYKNVSKENISLRMRLKKGCILIGESNAIHRVTSEAMKVANTSASVFIIGESGTGKELVARFIHQESLRKNNQMISINCGALPETMLERELFGHEKGSFTGADSRRIGLFEAADKGTLFFDEICEMPPAMQVKLLRVLQEGTFFRLGGTEAITTDVRVIAAANRDPRQIMENGEFREDLFYRLNVVNIQIPPLRERRDDIPILINYFIKKQAEADKTSPLVVTPEAMNILINYNWPGNVRELKNAIDRAIIMGNGKEIRPCDFPPDILRKSNGHKTTCTCSTLKDGLNTFKRDFIQKTLERTRGNRTEAARILDIERTYLSKLLKDLKIE